jgi:spore germination cell wall hydrolase CwlJ-like protein
MKKTIINMALMAAVSFAHPAMSTESQVSGFDKHTWPEEHCLALNIYYEARGSNLADKVAVGDVVLNRVNDTRYPNTICGVVQDGYVKGRRDCQFSWYCDGKSDDPQDADAWAEAQLLAWSLVMWDKYRGITEGATNYHATYVNPRWASGLQFVGTIGAHKFYRWEK